MELGGIEDWHRHSYGQTAQQVLGSCPEMLVVLGRGIERWQYLAGNQVMTSEKWRPTPIFERIHERKHTGFGECNLDLAAEDVRIGGGNANVRAAYILLRGLAELGESPRIIGFAAGRGKYLEQEEPTLSEGKVMSEKLLRMLGKDVPHYGAEKAYEVASLDDLTVVCMPHNRNTEDDLRMSLQFAYEHDAKNVRFITVGVHVPRCNMFLSNMKQDIPSLDAALISADHVLQTFRPAYKVVADRIRKTPAYAATKADESMGIRRFIDGTYYTT